MKPQFLLLALVGLPFVAKAQDTVVAPVEGRELRFDFPRMGSVYARDVRAVTLPNGRSKLQIEGLRSQLGESGGEVTLRLETPAKVLQNLAFVPSGKSYGLSNFVGERVSLVQGSEADPTKTKTLTGVLRMVDGRYALEMSEGTILSPDGKWLIPNSTLKETKVSLDPLWLVEGNGPTKVETNYKLQGITWAPRYIGFLSPDRKSVELQGWVDLTAPDSFDWRGANFNFTDNGKSFKLPAGVTPRGGKSSLSFWDGRFSVVQSLSYYNTDWKRSHAEFQQTQRTYKTVENAGAFLPTGPLTLWQQSGNGTSLPSAFESFGAYSATSQLILPLSDSTDEAVVKRIVTSNKLLNPQTREVVITWQYRGKPNGATLSITDDLPSGANIKEASLKPVENSGDQLRFEVSGESVDFTYRFQLPA